MEISTPFCAKLGCEHPIMQASVSFAAGSALVSAVSRAGAFGVYSLNVSNKNVDAIASELNQVADACKGKPFGVDFSDEEGQSVAQLPVDLVNVLPVNVRVVICSTTVSKSVVEQIQQKKVMVGALAFTVKQAKDLVENLAVDFVIAGGAEAGGHTGEVFTSVLLPQIVDALDGVPVVASGGVFDGRGLASVLCYGASAAWVGTRFVLTHESQANTEYKNALLQCTSDDTQATKCYTGSTMRVLRNEYTTQFEKQPTLLEKSVKDIKARCEAAGVWSTLQGKPAKQAGKQVLPAGQSAGLISALVSAQDVVREMVRVAAATLTMVNAKYAKADGNIHTPLCDMLGVKTCIMSAGMGGIAGKEMTAVVSREGGFGTFGSALDVANNTPDQLLKEIQDINSKCAGTPFGVDILVHGADGGVMIELIDAFAKGGAKVFVSGKGNPSPKVIGLFHERGMLVGSICGKLAHAKGAVKSGVDFVIVQGAEGGGHTGQVALSALLPQVVDEVGHKVPVIAAGGVYDGRGLASALCYGAQGVWVGTRFMMSPEGQTSAGYKSELLKYESEDTTVTKCYTGATMRVIRNPYVTKYAEHPELLEDYPAGRAMRDGVWKLHSGVGPGSPTEYDINNQALVTGQNIGAIDTLKPCADIVKEMNSTCWKVVRNLSAQVKKTAKL